MISFSQFCSYYVFSKHFDNHTFRNRVSFYVLLLQLRQMESLLAAYVLFSQFVDVSYTWVMHLSLSLISSGLSVNGV